MTAAELVALLTARGQTLGCAESLTGGLLTDAIVQVPGACWAYRRRHWSVIQR